MNGSPGRLAEPLAAFSLAGDLGMGFELEHALRTTYLAGCLAETAGLDDAARANVFWVALLHGIGCVADAHDLVVAFAADEIALKQAGALVDGDDLRANLRLVVRHAGSAGPLLVRPLALARALTQGTATFTEGLRAHCELGDVLAARVGLPEAARLGLRSLFDRWDGKGIGPARGDEIPLAARVYNVAKTAAVFFDAAGPETAIAIVRSRAGRQLEPRFVEAFAELADASPPWEALADPDLAGRALALEPAGLRVPLSPAGQAGLCEGMADFADLKSPALIGHSRGVAVLAEAAAGRLGLAAAERRRLREAALVHDLGRVSVPNTVLDEPGALAAADWERVRLHPYYTERVLSRSTALTPLASLAGAHHERLDGSGYHRGSRAPELPPAARILAAADCYQALTSERPHRPAGGHPATAAVLHDEVRAGRLDGDAVEAVVAAAAGLPVGRRVSSGRLSEREIEVLDLLARGCTTRDVATSLSITEKTVRHHVEHVYDKLGVSTRAGAVAMALGEGLLAD